MRWIFGLTALGILGLVVGRFVDYGLVNPQIFTDPVQYINYLSYFTIQTNLLIAGFFIWGAINPGSAALRSSWTGALALYGAVTAITFWTLLTGSLQNTTALGFWTNSLLHVVAPLAMVLVFLLRGPQEKIPASAPIYWLIFPLAYAVYTLIHGAVAAWFPYFFVDPAYLGSWGLVIVMVCAFAGVFLVLGYVLWVLWSWFFNRKKAQA